MNAAPLPGLDEAIWLGGIAAPPRAIGAAALTPDPFAACLARGTTLVVADAASAGGLAGLRDLAALARAMGVTLAVKPGEGGLPRAVSLAGALDAAVAADGPLPALPPVPQDSPTRIVSVTTRRIALPLKHLYVSSMYCTPKQDRTLVCIRLADGTEGWGETNGTPDCAARVNAIAKGWIGRDALRDRAALRRSFARIAFDNRHGRNGLAAYAGLDLAAWDASARHLGVPLAALLGQSAPLRPVEVACPLPAAVPGRAMERAEITAHMADLSLAPRVADLAAGIAAEHGIRASSTNPPPPASTGTSPPSPRCGPSCPPAPGSAATPTAPTARRKPGAWLPAPPRSTWSSTRTPPTPLKVFVSCGRRGRGGLRPTCA